MIVVVNPNPAVDHVAVVDFRPGSTLRAERAFDWPGGSGTHAACVAAELGADVTLVTSLGGGAYDDLFRAMVASRGIALVASERRSPTRQTYSVVDRRRGNVVDIAEPGGAVTAGESDALLALACGSLDGAGVCVVSGSVPPGAPTTMPARVVAAAAARGVATLVDATGEVLRQAVAARPWAIKPSLEELVRDGVVEPSADSVLRTVRAWLAAGVGNVLLSLAAAGLLWFGPDGVRRLRVAPRPAYNTIGCGDAMVGAIAAATDRGETLADALRWGLAAATANLAEDAPGKAGAADVWGLLPTTAVDEVDESDVRRLLDEA